MKLRNIFFLLIIIIPQFLFAQKNISALNNALDALSADPDLKHASWSFCLMDPATKKVLSGRNYEQALTPASVLKLVTSGVTLDMLGADYRFKTLVQHTGAVVDGVLKGDLIIKGGGDPTLGTDRMGPFTYGKLMDMLADSLKMKGIKSIEGNIIADASIFEDAMAAPTWVWSDLGNYYGAGASGLTINENMYELVFAPGSKPGDTTSVLRTEPSVPGLIFANTVTSGSYNSGDNAYIFGAEYNYYTYLRGTIPAGRKEFAIKGSIPDPPYFTAWSVREVLNKNGITVTGNAVTERQLRLSGVSISGKRKTLITYQSPKLEEVVYWINKKSVNLYTEHLLKIAGYVKSGKGSHETGIGAVQAYASKHGVGAGLFMEDGCGLSRYNAVTTKFLCGFLSHMTEVKDFEVYENSLSVAGDPRDPGTCRSLCRNTPAAKRIKAKSGYISRVRSYAGYVYTLSGQRLSFAFICNNYACSATQMRQKMEDVLVEIVKVEL